MNHLFVPYEIALQLKEKGFDEFCIGLFNEEGLQYDGEIYSFPFHNSLTKEGAVDPSIVAAPLYQQVIDWFREKQGIVIELTAYEVGWMTTLSKYPKIEKYIFQKVEIESYYDALNKGIEESLKLI